MVARFITLNKRYFNLFSINSDIVVCSPLLEKTSYKISSGDSHSGTLNEFGIYAGGSYTGGTSIKTFTISNIITTVN